MNGALAALCRFTGLNQLGDLSEIKNELPHPDYPPSALMHHEQGVVIVAVTFGKGGNVTDCRVLYSNASRTLNDYTLSFIRNNWRMPALAGRTMEGPVVYSIGNRIPPPVDFPPPPIALCEGHAGKVILNVSFDREGYVQKCSIGHSSGYSDLDDGARAWAVSFFHHQAFAGKTVSIPLQFAPGHTASAKKG